MLRDEEVSDDDSMATKRTTAKNVQLREISRNSPFRPQPTSKSCS